VRGSDPRFLGPQIPIEGDGRVSWGPSGPPPRRDAWAGWADHRRA
jgi:hypothetical protein